MSEQLHLRGEAPVENDRASQLEILSEMSEHFNPEKARQLAEADKPKQQTETSAPSHLEVLPSNPVDKPVAEMTKDEADTVYDDIVSRLSKDFVCSTNEKEKKELAARIIDAEIVWKSAGDHLKEIDSELSALQEREDRMGFFKKLFSIGERQKLRKQLLEEKHIAYSRTLAANKALRRDLAYAYGAGKRDFDYFGFTNRHDYVERSSANEFFNQVFFDDKNMKDIATAMEIRLLDKEASRRLTDKTIPHPNL